MKRALVSLLLILFISTIACSQPAKSEEVEQAITGAWIVENPPKDYQGAREYLIRMGDKNEYKLYIHNAIEVIGILYRDENAIHYQIKGFGPDGPEEKVVLVNGKLISYYLDNAKWVKVATFYKKTE